MTAVPGRATKRRLSQAEWIILALLVASVFINYVDRGNLSIAAPLLEKEIGLTPAQLGALLSSFFWTYAGFQLFGIAGWLVDRFDVTIVFAIGFFIWSAATGLTGLVSSFTVLFAMRLVLGAGESVAYPCYSKLLATHFPEHHRGIANALLDAGSKMGPALGTLLGGLLVARTGWRWFFILLGAGCLLWLIPWFIWRPRGHGRLTEAHGPRPTLGQLLRVRSAWGTFFGLFCANYFWFFLLTWLPSYLIHERGMSMDRMATVGGLAYAVMAVTTVASGWVSDRWIASGATPTRVRKTLACAGLTGTTIILPVAIVEDPSVSIAFLLMACGSYGIFSANLWAITQTLAGPAAAGRWTSVQNGIGNLAGVTSPWIAGILVQRTGQYYPAFLVASFFVLLGAFMYGIVIQRIEPVDFRAR